MLLLYLYYQTYSHNSAAIKRSLRKAVNNNKNSFQIHETLEPQCSKKGNMEIRHNVELLRRT